MPHFPSREDNEAEHSVDPSVRRRILGIGGHVPDHDDPRAAETADPSVEAVSADGAGRLPPEEQTVPADGATHWATEEPGTKTVPPDGATYWATEEPRTEAVPTSGATPWIIEKREGGPSTNGATVPPGEDLHPRGADPTPHVEDGLEELRARARIHEALAPPEPEAEIDAQSRPLPPLDSSPHAAPDIRDLGVSQARFAPDPDPRGELVELARRWGMAAAGAARVALRQAAWLAGGVSRRRIALAASLPALRRPGIVARTVHPSAPSRAAAEPSPGPSADETFLHVIEGELARRHIELRQVVRKGDGFEVAGNLDGQPLRLWYAVDELHDLRRHQEAAVRAAASAAAAQTRPSRSAARRRVLTAALAIATLLLVATLRVAPGPAGIEVLVPTEVLSIQGNLLWVAQPGERFVVSRPGPNWILAVGDLGVEAPVWILNDSRIRFSAP